MLPLKGVKFLPTTLSFSGYNCDATVVRHSCNSRSTHGSRTQVARRWNRGRVVL